MLYTKLIEAIGIQSITRKVLLTSTGFTNKNIERMFLTHVDSLPDKLKCLFVTAAAVTEDAKSMIPLCKEDLTSAGVLSRNIITYNFEHEMSVEDMCDYDAIYLCGGSSRKLLYTIINSGMRNTLVEAVNNGLFYIGVSAGAVIGGSFMRDSLQFIPNRVEPHVNKNPTKNGLLHGKNQVNISDSQAIWIYGKRVEIFE